MKQGSALRRLMTHAGALAIGGIVAQATYVGIEALIARRLGAHGYGIFTSSYALIMVMVHAMDMGMYWKLVQDGSRDPSTLRSNLGTMMVARIGLFVLSYPAVLAVLWWTRDDPAAIGFFALFALFGLQLGIQDLLASVYTARQRHSENAFFQASVPVAILMAVGALVIHDPTLTRVAVAFIVASSCVSAVWAWLIWRREKPEVRLGEIGPTLRGCVHYGVSGLVWNIYLRIGVLVLTFVSTVEQVAMFAAAFKLIDLFFKVSVLTNRLVAPRLYADSKHRPAEFVRNSDVVLRGTVAVSAMGALVLYAAGSWLVETVYGDAFAGSGQLLQILGVALTLRTIALMAQTIIAAADDHSYRTKVVIAATAIALAVAIPLAARWGAVGVAYAVVAGDVVFLALLMWRVWRTRSVLRMTPLFIAPLMGGALCAVGIAHIDQHAVLETIVCLCVFGAVLWVSGYLNPITAMVRAAAASTRK